MGVGKGGAEGRLAAGRHFRDHLAQRPFFSFLQGAGLHLPRHTAAMGIKKKAKTSHENTAADPGPAAATSRREMQGVTILVEAISPQAILAQAILAQAILLLYPLPPPFLRAPAGPSNH